MIILWNKQKGTGGSGGGGGGGSSTFPTTVTSSGSSLPVDLSGYNTGDTFLNTSDKKIYTAEAKGYSLNTTDFSSATISSASVLNTTTGILSNFGSLKITNISISVGNPCNICIPIKTGNDVQANQVVFFARQTGAGNHYDRITINIQNGKIYLNSNEIISVEEETKYIIDIEIELPSQYSPNDNISVSISDINGNILGTQTSTCTKDSLDFVFGCWAGRGQEDSYFGGEIYANIGTKFFTIYDKNVLSASLGWDSGTDITDKTEYADKTNGALYLYENSELVKIGSSAPTVLTDETATSMALAGNTIYKWTSALTSLSFASAEVSDLETVLYFTTGNTAPTFTDTSGLKWGGDGSAPSLEANTIYCISIRNGLAEIDTFGTVS